MCIYLSLLRLALPPAAQTYENRCVSIYPSIFCLPICLSMYPCICGSVHLPSCLAMCMYLSLLRLALPPAAQTYANRHVSIYPSIFCLPICLSMYPCVYGYGSVYLSSCLAICLSIHLRISPPPRCSNVRK